MKRRLSASIDDDLLAAAEAAVREGHAPSVSALAEEGLRIALDRARKLAAADELFAEIDAERGYSLSQGEIDDHVAAAMARAIRPNAPKTEREAA